MNTSGPAKKRRRGGTRRKTGCHTCKARHARCDEKKPVCSNCERLNLDCEPSDLEPPAQWNVSIGPVVGPPNGAADSQTQPLGTMPTTLELEDEIAGAPASTWDVFKARVPGLDIANEESPPYQHILELGLPTPARTVENAALPTAVNLTDETAYLLQTYLRTVARWMDLMDFQSTYQLSIPRLTLTSPLLFNCICAFTAKHLSLSNSRQNWSWDAVASHFYGEALRLLIAELNSPSRKHALTATILLSSYEILAVLGSESQRRHLLGATTLIKSHGVTAQSEGVDRANFWIYVRHDICVALAAGKRVILPPEEWNVRWKDGETQEDILGNQCLWILARVINLVYGEEGSTPTGKRKREQFLLELEEWRSILPGAFIGIPYGEKDDDGLRKTYFTVAAAAAAAFWYHVTHILLYAEPKLQDPSYIPHIQDQATRIASIAVSGFPDSLRVFATHGLYFAAKHIDGIALKARLWNVLIDVENQLGYHTRSIVKRLQNLVEAGVQ